MNSWLRVGVLLWQLSFATLAGAQTGVQNFHNLAPADVRPGRFAMEGVVLYGGVDGGWFKFKPESDWGSFSYRVTRLSATPGSLQAGEPPPRAAGAVVSGSIPWSAADAEGPSPRFWLEGEITAVNAGGGELEGNFAFKGEIVRLRLELLDNLFFGSNPAPSYRNVAYGPDPEQTLDFYRAPSSEPTPVAVYIHGGGWRHGDKSELFQLFQYHVLLEAGISVVSIDYRFCPDANPSAAVPSVAVPLRDCARAIQFVRAQAKRWGLIKGRLGIWGTSAGATTALWLATHPDMADPLGADEIARQSTRPRCAVGIVPQTSLDPRQMRAWVGPELDFGGYAFGFSDGRGRKASFEKFLAARDRILPWINEYSPAALLQRDGPPLFLDYRDVTLHKPLADYYTHSPRFGLGFLELAQKMGRECHLRYPGREDARYATWQQFLIAKLKD